MFRIYDAAVVNRVDETRSIEATDQRLEQILTIVDALADRVSDTGASVQVPRRVVSGWQRERKASTIQSSSAAV